MTPAGILRPSSAPRWAWCGGSFVMEAMYPEDVDTPEQREGTAAHFFATEVLHGRVHAVGTVAPNGYPIDAEMVECAADFIADVQTQCAISYPTPSAIGVEQKLTMHAWIHPDCEGTPDAYFLNLAAGVLIVWDYKYGHRTVDPFRHDQLLCYVAGVAEAHGLDAADMARLSVSLRIAQPRNYSSSGPVRRWDTTGDEVMVQIDRLRQAAMRAKTPGAPCQTGAHCRDCSAIVACEANRQVGGYAMDLAGRSTPEPLPIAALGLELRQIDTGLQRLQARRDGLAAVVMDAIQRGQNVPYFKRGYGSGRETWSTPLPEVFAMGDMMGADLRKEAAVTPAQARKLGVDDTVIQAYAKTPTGAAKLVPVDDNHAAKAFTGTTTQ